MFIDREWLKKDNFGVLMNLVVKYGEDEGRDRFESYIDGLEKSQELELEHEKYYRTY
jgi:hypothetical protein